MPTADKTFWFWDAQLKNTFTRKEFGDPEGTRAADTFLFVERSGDHSYYGDTSSAFYPSASDAEPPVLAPRDYDDFHSGNYFGSDEWGWDAGNIISHPRFYGYLERGKTYNFHLKDSAGLSKDRESWPGEPYNSDRKKHSDLFLQTSGKSTYDSSTQYTSGLDKTGLTNDENNGYTGTIVFTVPVDAPSILYVRGNSYRDLALPREPKNSRGERISDGFCDYAYNADWFASNSGKGYFKVNRGGAFAVEKTGYTSSAGPFSEIKKGYNKNVFGYDTTSGGTAAVKDGGGTFVVQLSSELNRNFDISILDPTSLDGGSTITPIGYYNPSTYNNQTSSTLRQFEIGKQVFDTPSGMSSPPTDSPQTIGTQNIVVYRGHTYVFHFTGGTYGPCGPSFMNGYLGTKGPISETTNSLMQFAFKTSGGSEYTTNMTYYSPPSDSIDYGEHNEIISYVRTSSADSITNTEGNIGIIRRYIENKLGKEISIPSDVYTNKESFLIFMKDCRASSGTLVWHVPANETNTQLTIYNRVDNSSDPAEVINIADPPGGSLSVHDNQNPATNDLPFPEAFFVIKDDVDLDDSDYDGIPDTVEGTTLDSDGDGIKDYLDRDSDNDGIPDSAEAGGSNVQLSPSDTDSDGTPDYLDSDSDDDGISDRKESETGDSDFDGIPDYQETDSDADNIPDSVEGNIDTDHDGFPNRIDTDSDNDGLLDIDEGTGDSDNDGVPDYLDKPDTDVGSDVVYKTIWLYDSQRTEDGLGSEKIRWAKDYRYQDVGYGKYKSFPHAFKYHIKDGDHGIEDAPTTPPLYPETHVTHVAKPLTEKLAEYSQTSLSENWGHDIPYYGDTSRAASFMYYNQDATVNVEFSQDSIDIRMENTAGGSTSSSYSFGKDCYAFLWNKDFYYDPSETGPLIGLDIMADVIVNNSTSSNHEHSLIWQPVVYVGQGENNATPTPDVCYLPGHSAQTMGTSSLFDQWRFTIDYTGSTPVPIQEKADELGFIHAGAIQTESSDETTQTIHKYYGKKLLGTCNYESYSTPNRFYTRSIPYASQRYLYGPGYDSVGTGAGSGAIGYGTHSFWPLHLGRNRGKCNAQEMNVNWDTGGRIYFGFVVGFMNWRNGSHNYTSAKHINFSVKNFKIGIEHEYKVDWQNIQRTGNTGEPDNYIYRNNSWFTANQHFPSVPTGLYMPDTSEPNAEGGNDV